MNRLVLFTGLYLFVSLASLCGQHLATAEMNFLESHAALISNDTSFNNSNWEPLSPQIADKQIILIGEPNHGSKEIFLIRNNLIKFLHEQHGFNTILFESGIGELILPEFRKAVITPIQMTYGFFGGWRTSEFRNLMEYVQQEQLSIAGFDVQRTGGSFEQVLSKIATDHSIDSSLYIGLEGRFGKLMKLLKNRKTSYDSVHLQVHNLIADYEILLKLLIDSDITSYKPMLLSMRTIENRISYLSYMLQFLKDKNWHRRWAARDSAMADNVLWLSNNIYQNEKLIIVAHNFHIAKNNEIEEVMGEFLKKQFPGEMYTLGVFAGEGNFTGNYGNTELLAPPDSTQLDIKHIIEGLKREANFINIPEQTPTGGAWLFNKIIVNDTFIDLTGSNKMILSKHFDGLILLSSISEPEAY